MAHQHACVAVERKASLAEMFRSDQHVRFGSLAVNGKSGAGRVLLNGVRVDAPVMDDERTSATNNTAAKVIAAGAAATISSGLYNPLDCLRVRWQVASKSDPATSRGIFRFGMDIVKSEGVIKGLWRPGLTSNITAMCLSNAARFGAYENVRDALVSLSAGGELRSEKKSAMHMLTAGVICGAVGYAWITPFVLVKTMIQAEKGVMGPNGVYLTGSRAGKGAYVQHLVSGAVRLAQDNGLMSLFRGTLPLSARGALFTSGQFMGYDGLKTLAKYHDVEDGPALHMVSSVTASLGASLFSAPADLIMAKYMADRRYKNITACIRDIYKEAGVLGFWRGFLISCIRLTPVMMTYSTFYEQFRLQLGIGYLT
mmetsp:Transcript_4475/g.12440  ORF Transcript_4475/g.12440 Transcript_4475/m.12440 type:complete len:369 (-) Transcript_4475:63-1169(-)